MSAVYGLTGRWVRPDQENEDQFFFVQFQFLLLKIFQLKFLAQNLSIPFLKLN